VKNIKKSHVRFSLKHKLLILILISILILIFEVWSTITISFESYFDTLQIVSPITHC